MAKTDRYTQKLKSTFWHSALWAGHMERASREDNPGFIRLSDLAIAFAGPNGHAEFGHGDLTRFLGKDSRAVDRAIDTAVAHGLLVKGSHRRCLQIDINIYLPYAGGGTRREQDARRLQSCPTCHDGPINPAMCAHPDRERYTSVEDGGLCESCYRLKLKVGK